MIDRLLDVPHARLALDVDDRDGGRTLVALHGLTSSRAADDASGIFGRTLLADVRGRVVRYDARGHGRSAGRPQPDDWRWSSLADDLLAVHDAVAPDERIDALGVSMGAGTIVWAAVRAPERFRRLVLVIPPTAWATRPASTAANEAAADVAERRGLAALSAAPREPLPLLEESGWPDVQPDMVPALAPSVFRGAARSDLPAESDIATALTMPVLLLPWAGDDGHPVCTAERLHALLPQSELAVARTPDDVRGWGARTADFLAD